MNRQYSGAETRDRLGILLLTIFFAALVSGCASTTTYSSPTAFSKADLDKFHQTITELRPAAEEGNREAQASLCILYFGGLSDYTEALSWCRKAADHGVPEAEFLMGIIYDFGLGTRENNPLSVQWFRLAAERGYAPAQSFLGVQYGAGEGVKQDKGQMIYWDRKAAEQGFAMAQYNLGWSYIYGDGVRKDIVVGRAWTHLAAAQCYEHYSKSDDMVLQMKISRGEQEQTDKVAMELEEKIEAQRKPYGDFDNLMFEAGLLRGCEK